ncbi:MAG: ATP-grasp enzyme D-alanine-D-alanine ligase [Chlamydiales bacterium]|jgi:D-alanine-D-alanine ligase|nr:ATP-grasp enzyme D-alanine-D-alanine ligase [Chlamydiales bacterium]
MKEKLKIAILFGERSLEHEISVLTAMQVMEALDPVKYESILVYVDQKGAWYTGEALYDKQFYLRYPASLKEVEAVTCSLKPGRSGLICQRKGLFGQVKEHFLPVDLFFLAFHGAYGEDGRLQALFEMADVPYASSNLLSSAMMMNKHVTKVFLKEHGIEVLPGERVLKSDLQSHFKETVDGLMSKMDFPLFVKPNRLGSSIGIGKATDKESLEEALLSAASIDYEVLVEPCLEHFLEINISILDGKEPMASVVEIPKGNDAGILTYEDKYLKGGKKGGKRGGMASLARAINPDSLSPEIKAAVKERALKIFSLLGCSGIVRLDFMLDLATDHLLFNEVNPIPGSLAFYLWQESEPELLMTEVLDRMIESALKKREKYFEEWPISEWQALKSLV